MVEDLDPDRLLTMLEESELQSRAAERRKLRYALAWARLHPATREEDAATWGDLGGRDRDCDLRLGGEGTPDVEAFAAEPFAAALGISTRAGMALIADALDLAHRLRRTQKRVEDLEVAPWRARRLAQATRSLSKEAAALRGPGPGPGPRLVRPHPDREGRRRRRGPSSTRSSRPRKKPSRPPTGGSQLHHGRLGRYAGTSVLEITGDTPTLTRFARPRLHDRPRAPRPRPPRATWTSARSPPSARSSTAPPAPHPAPARVRDQDQALPAPGPPTSSSTPRSGSAPPNASGPSPPP